MKLKKLFLIAFTLLLVTNLSAQDWRFGLKASPTIAWLKPDTKGLEPDGSKLTFSWGFMAEYFFAENYAISTGVDVGSYGGKLTTPNTALIVNQNLRLKYIDVPIAVKMRTKEIGYMRYFGQFGFTPGFVIAAKADQEISQPGVAKITKNDEDIKSDIIPINVSLLIALGAEYSLSGNTALVMSVSFHNGFIDIADFDILDPANNVSTKSAKMTSQAIRLNVGVLF